jgi:hypothetical protein
MEPQTPDHPSDTGADGASRLLALVDRSVPPHRPVGGVIHRWYAASGTALLFDEWADPATVALAAAFDRNADVETVEDAVVAFAQARAGAGHSSDDVSRDLVALVRLAWPTGRGTWGEKFDPVGVLARALAAWATEHAAASAGCDCIDVPTGLVTGAYLRERLQELHGQCRACGISPAVSFAGIVVRLDMRGATPTVRMGVRVTAGRLLARRFRGGETVAAVGPSRLVVVLPSYGVERAMHDVSTDLAESVANHRVRITVTSRPFGADAADTFRSLAGTSAGA